eukprot:m.61164 g.61164  ORF g.61164 m.61164 type:complete len:259 (+) comp22940_c1_seq1:144-920(+)
MSNINGVWKLDTSLVVIKNSQFVPEQCFGNHYSHCKYYVHSTCADGSMKVIGGESSKWKPEHFQKWRVRKDGDMSVTNLRKTDVAYVWKKYTVSGSNLSHPNSSLGTHPFHTLSNTSSSNATLSNATPSNVLSDCDQTTLSAILAEQPVVATPLLSPTNVHTPNEHHNQQQQHQQQQHQMEQYMMYQQGMQSQFFPPQFYPMNDGSEEMPPNFGFQNGPAMPGVYMKYPNQQEQREFQVAHTQPRAPHANAEEFVRQA